MTRFTSAIKWPAGGSSGQPARPDAAWCHLLAEKLLEASQAEPKRLSRWLPASVFAQLVSAATILLTADETLVEVKPPADARVVVVGDTHGQLHDVLHMLQLTGGTQRSLSQPSRACSRHLARGPWHDFNLSDGATQ